MKGFYVRVLFFALMCAAMVCGLATTAAAQATLTPDDCVKCHAQQPAEIASNGAAHKTEIDCQSCHEGHRPMVANNIPECSNCHEGASHYEVNNCMGCHNPHQPLNISLEGELKAVCVSCHASPGQQLSANPSMHAEVACNFCHADKHGYIPNCVECHSPHSDNMVQNDCATCHAAHKPLELMYSVDTGSILCASCHETAYSQLAASKTKHNQVACVTCHVNQHGTVPACSDCHGTPHAAAMHAKFPQCGDCHSTAHNLNVFGGN